MRWGFDRLCALVTEKLGLDPFSGHLYSFINRRRWSDAYDVPGIPGMLTYGAEQRRAEGTWEWGSE